MRSTLIAAVAVLMCLTVATSARAELVVLGSGTDVQEVQPSLSGGPAYEDDLEKLQVGYDRAAGTVP